MGVVNTATSVAVANRRRHQSNIKENHWEYYCGVFIKVFNKTNFFKKNFMGYVYSVNKDTFNFRVTQDYTKKKVWKTKTDQQEYEYFYYTLLENLKRIYPQYIFKVEVVEVKVWVHYENEKEIRDEYHWEI